MPSKVYGILAAGRPYIAATDPSAEPATIAREGGCGLVAAPGDAGALADAIVDAVRRSSRDARRWARGRAASARQFDRRVAVQAYHALFERVRRHRARGMIKRTFDCAAGGCRPGRLGAAVGGDRGRHQGAGRRHGALPAAARRPRRPRVRCAEVPIDGARRRGTDRPGPGDRERSARDARRPAAARHRDGRTAAAVEHLRRRHELRRPAAAAAGRGRSAR